ncbi:hypothetical protein A9B99_17140 [Mangrovibacter phragmitis]|uniref:Uncharacterized protein n=1 Tax=Mangrovibacter phragmitis TaxID=1691903 RepID=A0A1B7KXP5_9ENTR|nr:hypothetical protein [Mangrovibacter phragmitis]OAT74912.1 hypothetical protein A9B99_17140 [Mangrovibacter phragmitis]
MTAEIAVYNKLAVSLAADSAVTITGGNTVKINNGAEKLFALSKHHPVGLMVYGTGTLCGVPWEMIIKEYRRQLGETSYETIEQYAEKFWDFLCDCNHIIPRDIKENHLEDTLLYKVLPGFMQHIQDTYIKPFIIKEQRSPDTAETYVIVEEAAQEFVANFNSNHFYEGFDESDIDKALGFTTPLAQEACDSLLYQESDIEVPVTLVEALAIMFAHIICRKSSFGTNTGLVIAGYGEKEYFPSILAYDVVGFFGEKLRYSPNIDKSTSGGESGVTAYAQEDEVSAFMTGMSGELREFMFPTIESGADKILKDVVERIESSSLPVKEKEQLLTDIIDFAKQSWDKLSDEIRQYILENHVGKVVEMIEFLPKQDLGYMAESLVNLTAFKRKISNDSETVGGPIDVAIISKGDGFVWVKRKHYFDKELNYQYFKRN